MTLATMRADLAPFETQNPANLRGRLAVLTRAASCVPTGTVVAVRWDPSTPTPTHLDVLAVTATGINGTPVLPGSVVEVHPFTDKLRFLPAPMAVVTCPDYLCEYADAAGACWQATNQRGETIHCSTFATAIDTAQETRA